MADKYIDSPDKLSRNLRYWKVRSFLPDYIPLEQAVSTINDSNRLFEARQDYPGRWVVSTTCTLSAYRDLMRSSPAVPGRLPRYQAGHILHSCCMALGLRSGDRKFRAPGRECPGEASGVSRVRGSRTLTYAATYLSFRQTAPGSLCQFSYAFDTHHDRALWNAQEVSDSIPATSILIVFTALL